MNAIDRLKEIKEREALTYEEMARKLGVSWRTLYRWLNKNNKPSPMASMRIAEFIRRQNP